MTVETQRLVLEDFPPPRLARTLSPNGRAHWAVKSRAKQVAERAMKVAMVGLKPMGSPVLLTARFIFPQERRRDDDNLATGVLKVVRDCLVKGGILTDDNMALLRQAPVEVQVVKGQRRLEIVLSQDTRRAA